MTSNLAPLLGFLYGDAAPSACSRIEAAMDAHRARHGDPVTAGSPRPLDQRDVLAIAYPDHLRAPGQPPLQTLHDFSRRHLRGLVSGLHLLPFHPWSSDDGFAVMDYDRVDPALGTWEDIAGLGRDFDLMFDAVLNHLSARSEWFRRFASGDPGFRDFFVSVDGKPDLSAVVRPRTLPLLTEFATAGGPRRIWTTFGPDQVDLNYRNPEVLVAVVEALLNYVGRGARFIRLDAVAYLWKEPGTPCIHHPKTHAIVRLLRAVLDAAAPGVRLITETNVPHAENIAYLGNGRDEAHLVYNFPLPPLVLHAFRMGRATGLTDWARTLDLPSDQVTFLNFLASHDGIGVTPARGLIPEEAVADLVHETLARGGLVSHRSLPGGAQVPYELNINLLDALGSASEHPATMPWEMSRRFLCAHAILLSLQGVPALYLHSMLGSRGDRPGAAASGIPRRINREKLDAAGVESGFSNPDSLRSRVFSGLAGLLSVRRQFQAFAPAEPQEIHPLDPRVFAVVRGGTAGVPPVLCLHNVSPETVTFRLPRVPGGGASAPIASSPWAVAELSGGGTTTLGPHGYLWLAGA